MNSRVEITIKEAIPGVYWARYKDHGWKLIEVIKKMSLPRFAVELSIWYAERYVIPKEDWFKYQDLREVKEPAYGD